MYGIAKLNRYLFIWFYICCHAKSRACSFKNVLNMPILVLSSLVWFNLVIFQFGLVWFCMLWCVTSVQICYFAKSWACSFKNSRVMPILVLFGLVWLYFGLVWYGSASFDAWLLSRYVTMQNLELVASKISELCQFQYYLVWFGYILVWFCIVLHHLMLDYYPDMLPCKIWSL